MTPSERIKYIRKIGTRLGSEDWPLIDLTLKQFKLPTTDMYQGPTSVSYVMDMIGSSGDSVLIELARHVGLETVEELPEDPSCWLDGHFRVFISHVSSHKSDATELQTALKSFHVSAFVAHIDIEPTKKWQDEIEIALKTAHCLVALLVPGFHESKWTDQEIGFALGRGLLVVPIRVGLDPYGFIGKYQGFQGAERNANDVAKRLVDILVGHELTRDVLSRTMARKLADASSFQEAKDALTYLERFDVLDKKSLNFIDKSIERNGQVKGAYGVPERIKRLLQKFEKI